MTRKVLFISFYLFLMEGLLKKHKLSYNIDYLKYRATEILHFIIVFQQKQYISQ